MMEWVIGTGVAVSLLIVLVLIVRRPFARMFGARAAYALWLLPFIRLVMPEVTIPRIFPQFANSPAPETSLPSDIVLTPEMIATLQTDPTFMSQVEPYMLPAALGIWALGAIGFFLFHWVAQASLMDRLTYESEPASVLRNEVISAAQAVGLKRVPQVRISDEKAGPLVAGFLRPIVILPDNFMTAFSPQQRYYALMHEFMHVKRGDVGMALIWLAFRAVNWPNPLVHYAAKHFRSDQEAACDASVLSAMGDSQSAAETHISKSIIKFSSDEDGTGVSKHYEINIEGDNVEAFEIDNAGRKTSIDASKIEGFDLNQMKHSKTFSFGLNENHDLKFMKDSDVAKWVKDNPSYKGKHIIKLGSGGENYVVASQGSASDIEIQSDQITVLNDVKNQAAIPTPPKPPVFSQSSENVFVLKGDSLGGLDSLKALEALKGLEGLEKLEALKALKNLKTRSEGTITLTLEDGAFNDGESVFMIDDNGKRLEFVSEDDIMEHFSAHGTTLKMHMAVSKLAAARAMLEDTDINIKNDSREMVKAKRELEKARKALRAAEQALNDAE